MRDEAKNKLRESLLARATERRAQKSNARYKGGLR
jgi:hypothetical protein